MNQRAILIFALIILALIVGYVVYGGFSENAEINSFQDCVNAGYPILESYPEQCKTNDGRTFINN